METQKAENNNFKRIPLDASFEGVNRLIVLVFNDVNNDANRVERDSNRKYFLPIVIITN